MPGPSIRIPRLFGLVHYSLNRTFVIHRARFWKGTHPTIPPCRIADVDSERNQPVRRSLVIGAASLLLAAGSLAGCSANAKSAATAPTSTTSVPAGPVINLSSLMFNPSTTTVKVGTTVTWRNDEPITHTVTSGRFQGVDKTTGLRSSQDPDGTFNAKLPGNGKTFSFTYTEPGNYTYYCDIHQGMNATITVVTDTTSSEGGQR
jgi:plastocyanin